ncbi:FlgD immunoglobulin-like domain containing protein [Pedobacter sp. P351]|uniref:T9SS type A sorting domain-containing protein n=1 Tax=Pedobacter superstes TaxID=3133441 RepID=UPI0030B453FA
MSFKKILFTLIVILNFSLSAVNAQNKDTVFSFTIQNASRTSAGIFKSDGTLVRTLWNGVKYDAGSHQFQWDGKDDNGVIAATDKYTAKVLSNNVDYQWEGVIGNTSTALTGSTKLRMFDPLTGMAVAGNTIYWSAGYNEGWPATYKTSISNPNSKTWIEPLKQSNAVVEFVCTDGVRVFWSGYDPFDTEYESFVFATNVSDDIRVPFSEGIPVRMELGTTYLNAITVKKTSRSISSIITGLAVQTKGSYLFVSRKALNEIQVLDRITGKLIQTLSMQQPSTMKIDMDDNLWLSYNGKVEKFNINSNGTIISTGIVIELSKADAIAVSPDNKVVSINDIASGKVKSYSVSTGSYLWELGNEKNYMEDATVYDDKFYWKDINKEYHTFLSYMPDGSLYVGDPQNRRVQHFSESRTYIDNIMYQTSMYTTALDQNNVTRLFADFFEFKIDYSKPLTDQASWKLTKNWGATINKKFDPEKMKCITTFPNGRTYGRLRLENSYYLAELIEGSVVRVIESPLPQFTIIGSDGSKIIPTYPEIGKQVIIRKYPITGFDASNNPIWSNTPEILATTPTVTSTDPSLWNGLSFDHSTSSGKIVIFDPVKAENGHGEGFHLGAINKNGNSWLWKTAKSTPTNYTGPFPPDGAFDSGNGVVYAGGTALISEKNIFWGYHGEFWKGSQTNKWNHVYDNGLLVGQFGELTTDHPNVEAFQGGAGNVFTGSVVKIGENTYLYHNDESVHGGVHRWKINGLNTIQEQDASPVGTNFVLSASRTEGIDLLHGLVRGKSLTNEQGWQRDPSSDYKINDENSFSARIGEKSYDIFTSPDLFILYRKSSGTANIIRDLGTNIGLSSWKLSGKINYDNNSPNEPHGNGGGYMEVLDKNGLIITRFYVERDKISGVNIIANGVTVKNLPSIDFNLRATKNQPIDISTSNGMVTFTYADFKSVSCAPFDANADWRSPSKLRFHFFTKVAADNYDRSIDIAEMRFIAKKNEDSGSITKASQAIVFNNIPESVIGGTILTISATASSGLPVSLQVVSGPASISGNVLNFTGYGTVKVLGTQAGDDKFQPTTAAVDIVNRAKSPQTIAFSNATQVTASAPLTLAAIASSGLPVSFEVLSGPGVVSGNILSFTGYGTVSVQAKQAGSNTFEAASALVSITNSAIITPVKTSQTIVFSNTPATSYGSTPITLNAVASSGLPVSFEVLSGPGTISGNILSFTGYGTVSVRATQAGNTTFEAASALISITNSAVVSPVKTTQTIVFNNAPTTVYEGSSVTLTAAASSGLAVSFNVLSGPGIISGNILSFTGLGTVRVQATQAGNNIFEASTATVSIHNSKKASQNIKFVGLKAEVYGISSIPIQTVASSGLPIELEVVSGKGYIENSELHFTEYGPVVIKATQPGNDAIEPATASTVVESKPNQAVKVYPNPMVEENVTIRLSNVPKGAYVARFLSITGQVLYTTTLDNSGESEEHKLRVGSFPPGICVLQITGKSFSFTQKLIK